MDAIHSPHNGFVWRGMIFDILNRRPFITFHHFWLQNLEVMALHQRAFTRHDSVAI
jgi:hypothetical protein